MTEAEKERAAVVAWLRDQSRNQTRYRFACPEYLANAIARGDHLTTNEESE